MPALHAYRNKDGHYALAGIQGKIVTFRLTSDGVQLLHDSGVADGDKFPWPLLLTLIRRGDAYTGSGGGDEDLSGWEQIGFEFDDPSCEAEVHGQPGSESP